MGLYPRAPRIQRIPLGLKYVDRTYFWLFGISGDSNVAPFRFSMALWSGSLRNLPKKKLDWVIGKKQATSPSGSVLVIVANARNVGPTNYH